MASRSQRNRRDPQSEACACGYTSAEKSELLSSLLEEQRFRDLLNAKPENVERESEIVAQGPRWRRDHCTEHGVGARHYLGGNSDYMARIAEVPLGRRKPEDDHSPSAPATQCYRGLFDQPASPTQPQRR